MNPTKRQLYDLVQALHAEYKLPAKTIAELIGKSPRQVHRILEDLGIKRLTVADRIKALPAKIVALCSKEKQSKMSQL